MAGTMEQLLKKMVERGASDLHISVGSAPHFRIDERLVPADDGALNAEDARKFIYSLLVPKQIERFEHTLELDFAFGIAGVSRYRGNVFIQRGQIGCAIRALPFKISSFEELGLPIGIVTELSDKPKGLVLVTGPTGSGKSTTIASMIDRINLTRPSHIVTIEDPIEYVHANKKSIVNQREIESDTNSFADALKHVLRQDPDCILIGEMRDLETMAAALNIAETGHLVFATLHTSDCTQTVNRIVDVFPASAQQQIRTQLSFVLLGVLSQQLIPRAGTQGRALACEVMIATHAIRSLIREAKAHQIYSVIQTSQKEGMKTMNQSLSELVLAKRISYEEALMRTLDPQELMRLCKVKA